MHMHLRSLRSPVGFFFQKTFLPPRSKDVSSNVQHVHAHLKKNHPFFLDFLCACSDFCIHMCMCNTPRRYNGSAAPCASSNERVHVHAHVVHVHVHVHAHVCTCHANVFPGRRAVALRGRSCGRGSHCRGVGSPSGWHTFNKLLIGIGFKHNRPTRVQ